MSDEREPVEIRRLSDADLPAWVALQVDASPDGFSERSLAREFRVPVSRRWGAFSAGRLVGSLIGWQVIDELQIIQVVVAAAARRQGIGRSLMEAATATSRDEGGECLTLEVRAGNEAAIALYRALGFEAHGQRRGFYSDGEDAVWMRLVIAEDDPPDSPI